MINDRKAREAKQFAEGSGAPKRHRRLHQKVTHRNDEISLLKLCVLCDLCGCKYFYSTTERSEDTEL